MYLYYHLKNSTLQAFFFYKTLLYFCPVAWGFRIHRLLCRGVIPAQQRLSLLAEVPVMLGLWGMQSTLSLVLLHGQLWPGVVALDRVLSIGQIELSSVLTQNWIAWKWLFWQLNCVLMLNWIVQNRTVFDIETVLLLNWIVWNRTVWLNWIAWNKCFWQLNCVLMLN